MNANQNADRRRVHADADAVTINYQQAGSGNPAAFFGASYQGSAEPFRKPDHRAKRHSRPTDWAQRHDRRERQEREWAL